MFDYFKKTSAIGLDLGNSSIRLLQLVSDKNAISVCAASEEFYPTEIIDDPGSKVAFVKEKLPQMIKRGHFIGNKVVSAVPNSNLSVKSLRLEMGDDTALDSDVKREVATRFSIDPMENEINYIVSGVVGIESQSKREVVVFSVEHEVISQRLEMLDGLGLESIGLDILPSAIFRSTLLRQDKSLNDSKDTTFAMVDIGNVYTTITIARNNKIAFVKVVPVGGKQFNETVASRLGITSSEAWLLRKRLLSEDLALTSQFSTQQAVADSMAAVIAKIAREISMCFRYYAVTFRGQRPDTLILSGGEAREPVLMKSLHEYLDIDIRISTPFKDINVDGNHLAFRKDVDYGEWTVALGLSLKYMDISGLLEKSYV